MITNVKIGKVVLQRSASTPESVLPLLNAVEAGEPLEPVLTAIVKSLGFDTFMFGLSAAPEPNHESQSYVYTTLPAEWVIRYDQMDYIEIDPRILKTYYPIPFIWDSRSERGHGPHTDAFLDDAAAHGVASGFTFEFKDAHFVRGLMALNSANPIIDEKLRASISRKLGEILVLGTYFHEILRRGVIDQGVPPLERGEALSQRQRECLALAAHGLTTDEIAQELRISTRTAQYHFDSIRTKLGAATRQEAVARGIAQGVIALLTLRNNDPHSARNVRDQGRTALRFRSPSAVRPSSRTSLGTGRISQTTRHFSRTLSIQCVGSISHQKNPALAELI